MEKINKTEAFILEINKKFNNTFVYVEGEFKNNYSLITLKCKKCNVSLPRTAKQIRRFGCCGCSKIGKMTDSIYKEKVYNLVGTEYSVIGNYTKGTDKIKMKHNKCGHEWEVISKNFIRTNKPTRCPLCSSKSKLGHTEFLKRFKNIDGSDNFEITGKCEGLDSNVKLKCKKCDYEEERKSDNILRTSFIKCKNCQCNNISSGVRKIIYFLNKNKINYHLEVYFDNFKSNNGNKFKYDIYVPSKKMIIEFDGIQHFQNSNKWFSSEVHFRDILKNKKILNSDYNFLRISYKEINEIKEILSDIFGGGSTTIRKYNLLYINANTDEKYNLDEYYTSRSTPKQVETGDFAYYDLSKEDIVSTLVEAKAVL